MLRPVAKLSRIIGQLPRGRVIFVSPNRVRRKANFGEKLTHEAGLVSAVSSGYDLGFAAALRNNRLALAFPRGRPAIEVKDHASRGFPSIFAVSPGSIGKEKEAVGQCRVIVARVPNAVQWVTLKVAQDSNRKRPVSRTGVGEVLSETAHLVGNLRAGADGSIEQTSDDGSIKRASGKARERRL